MVISAAAARHQNRSEGAPHDLWYDDIYLRARRVESDRDLLGIHRDVRSVRREAPRQLDRYLFSEHGGDERDRVPVSIPPLFAVPCGRHRIAVGAGGCDPRALRLPPRRYDADRM